MKYVLLSFIVLFSLVSLFPYVSEDIQHVSTQDTHLINMAFAIEYSPPIIISNPHDQSDFHFGQTLETVGNKIVVGNPDSNLAGSTSGSVFVYDDQLGNLLITIKNPNPNHTADFGIALAEFDRTRIVIGDPGTDNSEMQSQLGNTSISEKGLKGAVYIYDVYSGEQILTIYPPNRISESEFGASVDVTDNKNIIVGSPKSSESGKSGGLVYLFDSSGEHLLTISDPFTEQGSEFGSVVAAFGDDILVANPVSFSNGQQTGHVYLFDGKTGDLIRTFENNDSDNIDSKSFARFGDSVSVNQKYVLVGAPKDNSVDSQAGSIFLFDGNSGELVHKITNPNPVPFGEFGSSLKLVDDYIFVGAPKNLGSFDVISEENPEIISEPDVNVDINPNSGIVFVYEMESGNLLATLENPSPNSDEHFGMTVESIGNNVVVGAPFDTTGVAKTGSIFIFYASDESPYVHDRVTTMETFAIPSWVKNTSDWWSKDAISDAEFIDAIQYMITKGLIVVSQVEFNENAPQDIPDWIKINAGWWTQDKISDIEFLNGIEFLIENGMLRT